MSDLLSVFVAVANIFVNWNHMNEPNDKNKKSKNSKEKKMKS